MLQVTVSVHGHFASWPASCYVAVHWDNTHYSTCIPTKAASPTQPHVYLSRTIFVMHFKHFVTVHSNAGTSCRILSAVASETQHILD